VIEKDTDPAIVSTTILQRAQEALQKAAAFGRACQNEARRHPGDSDPDDVEACVKQYSQHLAQDMLEEARAWFVLEPICNATLAVLMRLPQACEAIRHDPAFLADLAACPAQNAALQCLRDVLDVLEHEEMVVLHPALKRGYRIRISGIGRNYQLHTLLADALIGDPEQGWLPGQRPDPRVVAAAKDGPFPLSKEDAADFPHAEGAFLLWNWQGLQADGTLPVVLDIDKYWIWNEGKPADIVPFEEVRVILLSPPWFSHLWDACRHFPGMRGELEVLETFSPTQVSDWLARITVAVTR
jgi:hypothetical protein